MIAEAAASSLETLGQLARPLVSLLEEKLNNANAGSKFGTVAAGAGRALNL